ncbi:hypothetical protein HZ994_13720 [Akkermansiaceae bacterium]|nr:hypothetical protein HZ994_13720 [Akkermansiaceae bacterium]
MNTGFLKALLCMQLLLVGKAIAWTPGTYPAPSRNLTVDRQSRNDVLSFWHGVYQASEGFQGRMGWTGSYATTPGSEGTISPAFIADTERRLNFYRALAGVPANATLNTASLVNIQPGDAHKPDASTTKALAVQRAAHMIAVNYNTTTRTNPAYSHNPPTDAILWDASRWNAMFNGNITQGFHGPDAITGYVTENAATGVGTENSIAAHRRWILRAASTNFATGDVPGFNRFDDSGASRILPSNVLYVIQNPDENATVAAAFTAYPPAGFFPSPLNTKFWSLTRQGANFSAATVTVSVVGGATVAAVKQPVSSGAGDPTIVWQMPAADAATSFPADKTYQVTVSGITGTGVPASHSYQVTMVNPDILASDQSLAGTDSPNPSFPASYTFTPPPHAEALRVNTYRQIPATWTENAEAATASLITDGTAASYPLLFTVASGDTNFKPISGARSFRLAHPTEYDLTVRGVPEQTFRIDRKMLPRVGAALSLKYKLGFIGTNSRFAIEMSDNGGATWTALETIPGNDNASTQTAATSVSYPLPLSASPLSFRFRLYAINSSSGYVFAEDIFPNRATGVFIDDITVTNCDLLDPRMSNDLPAGAASFTLDSTTRGGDMAVGEQWQLALQTKLGNRWFPDGPLKSIVASSVVPATPYEQWLAENPGVTGGFADDDDGDGLRNGVEFAFFSDPRANTPDPTEVLAPVGGSTVALRRPLAMARAGAVYEAQCSETLDGGWSSENVTVTIAGGFITATAPRPPSGKCFLRWKITAQSLP